MARFMLTTVDNPYNPFKSYEDWYAYDMEKGYNSCQLLARVIVTSDELSEQQQEDSLLDALEEILEYNTTGLYAIAVDKEDDWLIAPEDSIKNNENNKKKIK